MSQLRMKDFDTRHGDFVELYYSFISGRRYTGPTPEEGGIAIKGALQAPQPSTDGTMGRSQNNPKTSRPHTNTNRFFTRRLEWPQASDLSLAEANPLTMDND